MGELAKKANLCTQMGGKFRQVGNEGFKCEGVDKEDFAEKLKEVEE